MNFKNELEGKKVVVIGGTAGMGLAIAKLASLNGAKVVVASRSQSKVDEVSKQLGAQGFTMDLASEHSIIDFFESVGEFDYLIIPGSQVKIEHVSETSKSDLEFSLSTKFVGPALCCKHARIKTGGAITLFSGALSRRPVSGVALLGAINGGVESLSKGLALELSPVRVNCISPGLVRDTEAYNDIPTEAREKMFAEFAESVPAKRVGKTEDIAAATLSIMTNPFMTGAIIDVDGGAIIR